ncbi:MAG: hypothetical protein ACI81W_003361 [Saprospiraceae bacterium]
MEYLSIHQGRPKDTFPMVLGFGYQCLALNRVNNPFWDLI